MGISAFRPTPEPDQEQGAILSGRKSDSGASHGQRIQRHGVIMPDTATRATLVIIKGANSGQCHEISGIETFIGRDPECNVVLPLQTISRRHARILCEAGEYYIFDLRSLNGTFVNGERVVSRKRLRDGDEIQIHDSLLGFNAPTHDAKKTAIAPPHHHPQDSDAIEPADLPRQTKIVSALEVRSGEDLRLEVNPQIKLQGLLDLIRSVGTSLDIDEVLPKVLESLFRIFPQADLGCVLIPEGSKRKLKPRAVKLRTAGSGGSMTIGPISTHVAARVMAEGKAILSSDGESSSVEDEATIFGGLVRSLMCAPLLTPSNELLGVLQVGTEDAKRQFLQQDLDVLVSIATLAGQLVAFARWHELKRAEESLKRELAATERERRRLKAVLNILPVAVFIADVQGNLIEANPEARELLGGDDALAEKQHYSTAYKAWWPKTGQPVEPQEWALSRALTTGEECIADELEIETASGERLTILNYAVPIRDDANCIIGGVAVNVDITDQNRAKDLLRDADRRKDEFLAMLAHELRNPLAPIRNALALISAKESEPETVTWAMSMMERQVEHLVRLVDDLLDVSRIMRGKIELRMQAIELAHVIARAVETSRPLIDEQGHQLTISMPDKPIYLHADLIRLAQVVANLLNNAAKYTENGGRIWLQVEREANQVALRIRDTGIGISERVLPHIFDLFAQADRSLDRSQGGLGIGLSLVQRLVELHGGTVSASSEGLGRGSEFVVRLPVTEVTPVKEEPRWKPTPTRACRVLVVDDQAGQAQILAKMLKQFWNHEVRTAHDGPTALTVADEFQPEIILLDIGLPGLTGLEVATRLRAKSGLQEALLVALTGYGQEEDRRRSKEAGFDEHLVKPASVSCLEHLFCHPKLQARVESS